MTVISRNATVTWDGEVTFGVLDENLVRRMGLLDDAAALLHAIHTGKLTWKRALKNHNTVTNYARNYVAQMLCDALTSAIMLPSQMELGTGSGTPALTDTDLWAPAATTLKPLSQIQVYLNYFAQYVCTWQTTDPIQGTWSEIGLKDANGNLWAHAAAKITVNTGEMLVGQWAVQIMGN